MSGVTGTIPGKQQRSYYATTAQGYKCFILLTGMPGQRVWAQFGDAWTGKPGQYRRFITVVAPYEREVPDIKALMKEGPSVTPGGMEIEVTEAGKTF